MKSLSAILIALLFFCHPAAADYVTKEQCASTDLTQKFGQVHNQLATGWCWGFVAQDLMSFAAERTQDPYSTQDVVATTLTTPPAALDQAADKQSKFDARLEAKTAASLQKNLLFSKKGLPAHLRGNGIHTAVAAYSARGRYCSASKSKLSQPEASLVATGTIPKPLLDFASVSAGSLVPKSLRAMKRFAEEKKRTPTDDEIEFKTLLCESPPSFGAQKFASLRAALNDKGLDDLKKHIDRACGEREGGPSFVPRTRDYDEESWFEKKVSLDLAENLGRGVPVGISFNAGFFMEGANEGDQYGHAAIVSGSRWNEKRGMCEFKIRNSWGTKCSVYKRQYATPDKCENGNVWVEERDILINVWSATTVRKN